MKIIDGWVSAAAHVPSPNFNARPEPSEVSLIVVHNISLPPGQFGTGCVQQFFCNQLDHGQHPYFKQIDSMKVSAHCLIERDGSIVQFVDFTERAWHAGRSEFNGQLECNDFSIGIELEGTDTTPYTNDQYKSLAELTEALMLEFPRITAERIAGHSDVAPGRKTDPGPAFDWLRFKSLLGHDDGP